MIGCRVAWGEGEGIRCEFLSQLWADPLKGQTSYVGGPVQVVDFGYGCGCMVCGGGGDGLWCCRTCVWCCSMTCIWCSMTYVWCCIEFI